uniref:CHK kinase-like domain-containing protein n=1 Tax=Bracon brevicornis TaxID=1563983 RepID=A0A6V7JY62_9HYME
MSDTALKDLQTILRGQLGDDLIVENYKTKNLLPPGENYGSKIISVHAIIKRHGKSNEHEDLYLIAKLPPTSQFQREMFDSPFTFRKEIFMYDKILKYYRQLEIESGDELSDISPVYYGSRLSMNTNVDFDDDAAILLENLKVRGYYSVERKIGFDLAHAQLAIKAMARFHALGMATKEKDPEFFDILKKKSKCLEFKGAEVWANILQERLQEIADDPEISQYYEACVKVAQLGDEKAWTAIPTEPWSTIIHSDFWANNILFHKNNGTDKPDDIKFVDYQNYLFLSPLRELTFFLGSGLNHETTDHINDMIDLYYFNLIEKLKKLNCNVDLYSRESFDEKIKEDGQIEFVHCLYMMKIVTMDIAADDPDAHDIRSLMEKPRSGKNYQNRLRDLVINFDKQGWLIK